MFTLTVFKVEKEIIKSLGGKQNLLTFAFPPSQISHIKMRRTDNYGPLRQYFLLCCRSRC